MGGKPFYVLPSVSSVVILCCPPPHVKATVMASPLPSSLNAILPAVKAQVSAVTGLPLTAIRTVGRRQTPRLQGDQDILLRPGDVEWDQGFDHGSGRICSIVRRPLLVTVRTRYNVDLSDSDDSRLTDPILGHIALEEMVCNALLDWFPQDANQDNLTQEPLHPLPYPAEEEQEGQAADWIETHLAFLLVYQLPLPATGGGY